MRVYSPEVLINEDKDNVFVFVFSYANYFDISDALNNYGYNEFDNYFVCTPNILMAIKGKQ